MSRVYLILLSFYTFSLLSCKSEDLSIIEKEQKIENGIYITDPGFLQDIYPHVKKAYEQAKDGDVIVLPEGEFAYTGYLEIRKRVSVIGAGINKTILYRPDTLPDNLIEWKYIFKLALNSDVSSGIVITGIHFKGKTPSYTNGDGGSLAIDNGIIVYKTVDFIIHDCKFENFGEAGINIMHKDNLAKGLVYNCQFVHNYKGNGLGYGYGIEVTGENLAWVPSPQFGSGNFIFIEDNYFQYHKHAITSGAGGLYVARYNKIYDSWGGAVDLHEARDATKFSSRASEIYRNEIVNTTFQNGTKIVAGQSSKLLALTPILIRGGEALIYENTTEGFQYGLEFAVNNYLSGAYPIKTQPGYNSALKFGENDSGTDSVHGDGDLFVWGNLYKAYQSPSTNPYLYNYTPYYVKEGRDFHLMSKPGYTPYAYPKNRK